MEVDKNIIKAIGTSQEELSGFMIKASQSKEREELLLGILYSQGCG